MRAGLVVHPGRKESVDAAVEAAHKLAALGVETVMALGEGSPMHVPVPVVAARDFARGLDLALSFGGDGTFLHAAYLCRDASVPVLGVNLGRLGFLAEVERDELAGVLEQVARGDFAVEERETLSVEVRDAADTVLATGWALNEVSIEKTARQRLIQLDVLVGGAMFARVPCDAMIVATATGSTAYALSAGGPLTSPQVRATLVVPVAPHTLFDRTLAVGADEPVEVRVLADQQPAIVSCDGRAPVTVPPGGVVTATGGGPPVRLARVRPEDFYGLVRRKFGLR